jgi:hypothetical protein
MAWAIRLGLEIWIQGAFFIFFFPSIDSTKPTTLDFYLLKYNLDIATVKMPRYTAVPSRFIIYNDSCLGKGKGKGKAKMAAGGGLFFP